MPRPMHEQPAAAEAVGQRAGRDDRRRERERVRVDDPLQPRQAGVEVGGDRRQRGVDHRDVEHEHGRGRADHGQRPALGARHDRPAGSASHGAERAPRGRGRTARTCRRVAPGQRRARRRSCAASLPCAMRAKSATMQSAIDVPAARRRACPGGRRRRGRRRSRSARPVAADRSLAICSYVIACRPGQHVGPCPRGRRRQGRGRCRGHVARIDVGRSPPTRLVRTALPVCWIVSANASRFVMYGPGRSSTEGDARVAAGAARSRRASARTSSGESIAARRVRRASRCGATRRPRRRRSPRTRSSTCSGTFAAGEEDCDRRRAGRARSTSAVAEVADGQFDVRAEHGRSLLGVADEGAARRPAVAGRARRARRRAGRAGHQDVHRVPPVLGGMLALRRKTLVGSRRSLRATRRSRRSP